MVEIILKESIKLLIASPIHQLDILRIRTENIEIFSEEEKKQLEEKKINKNKGKGIKLDTILKDSKWIVVKKPNCVFTAQHTDWIDFEKSAIKLPNLYIPTANISCLIDEC